MSWRIEPEDTARPVRIIIGGIGYCLTITDAMSLLRTAPKMAGKWARFLTASGQYDARRAVNGDDVAYIVGRRAFVLEPENVENTCAECGHVPDRYKRLGDYDTDDAARTAADAALRAAGWLLEEG